MGKFQSRPWPPRQAVLGVIPKLCHPRHPLDTAPKGVETHPGDGRLSVGNALNAALSHIYHAYLPHSPKSTIFFKSLSRGLKAAGDQRRSPLRARFQPGSNPRNRHYRNFDTNPSAREAFASCGLSWQKLERSFEKYGLWPREVNRTIPRPPFCKHLPHRCTSPATEKATAVDSGKQHDRSECNAGQRNSHVRCITPGDRWLRNKSARPEQSIEHDDLDRRPSHLTAAILSFVAVLLRSACINHGKGRRTWSMDRVDAYLETHRDGFEEQLKASDQDTQRELPAGPRRRHSPGRRVCAR